MCDPPHLASAEGGRHWGHWGIGRVTPAQPTTGLVYVSSCSRVQARALAGSTFWHITKATECSCFEFVIHCLLSHTVTYPCHSVPRCEGYCSLQIFSSETTPATISKMLSTISTILSDSVFTNKHLVHRPTHPIWAPVPKPGAASLCLLVIIKLKSGGWTNAWSLISFQSSAAPGEVSMQCN